MTDEMKRWAWGLVAAFIGGLAGAVQSGLTLMIMSPETFNMGEQLGKTLLTMLVLGVLSGVNVAAAYLKQSPLPRTLWTPEERAEVKAKESAAVFAETRAEDARVRVAERVEADAEKEKDV